MPLDTIGARLLAARKRRGWTIYDVQSFTSIPANTLSEYENDALDVPSERLEKLSRLYGVSSDWILTGRDTAENTRRQWPKGYAILTRLNRELTEAEKELFIEFANRVAENPEALKYMTKEDWDRILQRRDTSPK